MRTRLIVAGSLVLLAAGSCKDSAGTAAGGKIQARPAKGGAAAEAEKQSYALDISAPSPVARGKVVVAQVTVRPRGPYKINLEYPLKMTVSAPTGATMSKSSFAVADAREFTKQRIRIEPSFSLSDPGEHRFDGQIRFSVCTEALCELKRAKVSWTARTP